MSSATPTTTACRVCGGPLDRGRAGSQPPRGRHRTCLACQVASSLADWQPPPRRRTDYDDERLNVPVLPPALRQRLEAAGGLLLETAPSPWGSYHILTPACCRRSRLWMTPAALADRLPYWERGEDGP